MAGKTVLCLAAWAGSYAAIMSNRFGPWQMLALCCVLGTAAAAIGLNIAHDASHGAYSSNPRVNRFFAHAFTLLGVHEYYWNISHNMIHHGFTNIPGADADLHPPPILRYFDAPTQTRWYHRYQHIYSYGLYSLASLLWVFHKDYNHIANGVHDRYPKPNVPLAEYFILALGKGFHYFAFLAVPLLFCKAPFWQVLIGFLVMHLVTGTLLAIVFAVGHLVDDVSLGHPNDEGVIGDSFAAHQLRTTANFSPTNRLMGWAVGGLNFQIEHHLFPRVCHAHYRQLAPIVRATAAEFGLPYVAYESFGAAHTAHRRFLKKYAVASPGPISGG